MINFYDVVKVVDKHLQYLYPIGLFFQHSRFVFFFVGPTHFSKCPNELKIIRWVF